MLYGSIWFMVIHIGNPFLRRAIGQSPWMTIPQGSFKSWRAISQLSTAVIAVLPEDSQLVFHSWTDRDVQQGASKMDTMTCEKYVFCIGCSAERFQRVIQLPSGIASGWLDTMQDVWLHWCLMVLHHGREYRDYTVQSRSSVSCVS